MGFFHDIYHHQQQYYYCSIILFFVSSPIRSISQVSYSIGETIQRSSKFFFWNPLVSLETTLSRFPRQDFAQTVKSPWPNERKKISPVTAAAPVTILWQRLGAATPRRIPPVSAIPPRSIGSNSEQRPPTNEPPPPPPPPTLFRRDPGKPNRSGTAGRVPGFDCSSTTIGISPAGSSLSESASASARRDPAVRGEPRGLRGSNNNNNSSRRASPTAEEVPDGPGRRSVGKRNGGGTPPPRAVKKTRPPGPSGPRRLRRFPLSAIGTISFSTTADCWTRGPQNRQGMTAQHHQQQRRQRHAPRNSGTS